MWSLNMPALNLSSLQSESAKKFPEKWKWNFLEGFLQTEKPGKGLGLGAFHSPGHMANLLRMCIWIFEQVDTQI